MKRFSKGFTLIELIIVVAIVGILFAVVKGALFDDKTPAANNVVEHFSEGTISQQCKNGFVIQKTANSQTDVLDATGARVPCES